MSNSSVERAAAFYKSSIGRINEVSVVHACARLNDEVIERFGGGGSALFLGIGEAGLLELMAPRFERAIAVEGSSALVAAAVERFSGLASLTLIHSLFETYEMSPGDKVDWLLANHVLEHLDEPVGLLQRSRAWLRVGGRAVFTVPNAQSLHRRIGVEMGILPHVTALSGQDERVGHRRVYDLEQLQAHVVRGGFEILETGGFNVKLVSQEQMTGWSPELHEAIYRVSRTCPADLCSNIYVVARPCQS